MSTLNQGYIRKLYNAVAEKYESVAKNVRTIMKTSLEYAFNKNVLATNPAKGIDLSKKIKKTEYRVLKIDEKKTLTLPQVLRLVEASKETPIHMQILFAVLMGLRRSEIYGVKYSDVNYMESGVDITIKGAKHDKTELSGNRTNIANGESIKMEDFKHDEETDDVYTMTAVIKDKAGNETEKEVMFSVNRFGSNYIFSETTEKFLDDVYANKPKDLVVTEVNVDSLVFNGISYGLDGTKKELKPGSDYTVKQSGGEGSWKEYTYTIKKENFEKEGRYSVTIDSEDKATNKMNNKVKECNIDFVIDKTPPTVVITGIEESSYRADEREMTINLSDNTAVKCVDVIIDGKSVATYAQKEIEKAGGKISYMIEGASEPQKIEAAALDMAGNETTSEMHKVLVTSSVWIQYINNTPLLIGSILGIVLVARGLIWFFVIRKKKEESK